MHLRLKNGCQRANNFTEMVVRIHFHCILTTMQLLFKLGILNFCFSRWVTLVPENLEIKPTKLFKLENSIGITVMNN